MHKTFEKAAMMAGLLALPLSLLSCSIYIINGADGHRLQMGSLKNEPDNVASPASTSSPNFMTDLKNSKSGLYAIVNGTTLIRCNEYYQPHNLPEDPPIPIIPPDKDDDYKYIMNSLTTNISQKTTTITALRLRLQNEYRDVLQACLDSQ